MFEAISALITLTFMEIVLGIDNIIFISLLVDRVEERKREKVRKIGLFLALIFRILLLSAIGLIMKLTQPFLTVMGIDITGRSLILLGGGLFLLAKSTLEIHHSVEGSHDDSKVTMKTSVMAIIFQIIAFDLIFSLDSVITAIGMVSDIKIMVVAMIIAMVVMIMAAKSIGDFVNKHPSVKILALSFLLLIGVMLIVEGVGKHIGKGYIYFAMGFSFFVEMLNMRYRSKLKE